MSQKNKQINSLKEFKKRERNEHRTALKLVHIKPYIYYENTTHMRNSQFLIRNYKYLLLMSSVFLPFTGEEVESIRSVVMLGQQADDMLLTNSTSRPIAETRAFIRKFKKQLLDSHLSCEELAELGNQQYVVIITAARAKRNNHRMSSARSMMNLSLPFTNPSDSLPLKFRTKFSQLLDNDTSQTRSAIPTRSSSVSNGLSAELEHRGSHLKPSKSSIQVIQQLDFNFPNG